MSHLVTDLDFKALFLGAPIPLLVLAPDLTIVSANQPYTCATKTELARLIGQNIFVAFPANPDEEGATGHRHLHQSLQFVLDHARPNTMAIQKYDIQVPGKNGMTFEEHYWSVVNAPILDEQGNVKYIVHQAVDVTEFVRQKQASGLENQDKVNQLEREIFVRARDLQEQSQQLHTVNEDLREARDEAVKASQFKTEFLASMSHEIRTPMNGILGMTTILLRQDLPPRIREYISTIQEAGNSLLSVINGILDLSKIEAGKLELEIAEFQPVKLIESVADLLSEQARAKGVSLVPFISQAIPKVLLGDSGRLRQIIVNLTGNAIKFSDQSEVQIKAELLEETAQDVLLKFSITDRGIGLTRDEIARLFKPFSQSDATISKASGTGLGLSISKTLAEMMSGEMGVTSAKGEGSTFWFTVRLELPAQPSNQLKKFAGVRVLVVDDEAYSTEALSQYAKAWGMQVTTASSARDGLKKLVNAAAAGEESRFQIVLIDLWMPGMNGLDMIRAINENVQLKDTKLVLLTSTVKPENAEQAHNLGFNACLNKPIKQSYLYECFKSMLGIDGAPAIYRQADSGVREVIRDESGLECEADRPELVLIVEDHRINQQVALLILKSLGFQSHTADTGQAAVDSVAVCDYKLILMDVQMPTMSGFEATQWIRRHEKEEGLGNHIPIVAMTAHVTEGSREDCLAAGMDDYMAKPITTEDVKKMMDKWLPLNK